MKGTLATHEFEQDFPRVERELPKPAETAVRETARETAQWTEPEQRQRQEGAAPSAAPGTRVTATKGATCQRGETHKRRNDRVARGAHPSLAGVPRDAAAAGTAGDHL